MLNAHISAHKGKNEYKINDYRCHEQREVSQAIGRAFRYTLMVFLDHGQLVLGSDAPKHYEGHDEEKKRN